MPNLYTFIDAMNGTILGPPIGFLERSLITLVILSRDGHELKIIFVPIPGIASRGDETSYGG